MEEFWLGVFEFFYNIISIMEEFLSSMLGVLVLGSYCQGRFRPRVFCPGKILFIYRPYRYWFQSEKEQIY